MGENVGREPAPIDVAAPVALLTLDGDPWYEPSLDTLRALAPTA